MEAWQKSAASVKKLTKSGQANYFKKFPDRVDWFRQNHPDMAHFDTSVKQASKAKVVDKAALEKKSLQAYGAGGTPTGGEGGNADAPPRDTIVPLSRDQHSAVQKAKRDAEAAAKPAKPPKAEKKPAAPKPLTQAERIAAIRRAANKAQSASRFDVATLDPDDMDHDDLRGVHYGLHQYTEEVEQVDEILGLGGKVSRTAGASAMRVIKRLNPYAKLYADVKRHLRTSTSSELSSVPRKGIVGKIAGTMANREQNRRSQIARRQLQARLAARRAQRAGQPIPEEVEQIDEVDSRHSPESRQAALTPRRENVKAAISGTARDRAATNKYARRIKKLTDGEYSTQDVVDQLRSLAEATPPGMETWVEKNKDEFKKRYGDRGEEVLYATAWKMYNKKESTEMSNRETIVENLQKMMGALNEERLVQSKNFSTYNVHPAIERLVNHAVEQGYSAKINKRGDGVTLHNKELGHTHSAHFLRFNNSRDNGKWIDSHDHNTGESQTVSPSELLGHFKDSHGAAKEDKALNTPRKRTPKNVREEADKELPEPNYSDFDWNTRKFKPKKGKVKEEAEQIDERERKNRNYPRGGSMSGDTLGRAGYQQPLVTSGKRKGKLRTSEIEDIKFALRAGGRVGPGPGEKLPEEVEQIDEISSGAVQRALAEARKKGTTPTTPMEKKLASYHGNPNEITYGDVVKARIEAGNKGK